ncbi:hypothetical protein GALMADRAFT_137247 [Galerina marginata CBS 339.88]|uniref:Major facilitator superfamily (MFS) profile domain-containing protein n=1 Tax=Galerina marginata (strain CBS 339.88) TaxID=685588 RepID=A0A067THN4_GALM3|nr:hypothetical protein GALMADRAFT_137247 [Galerina marginata CBS 339.88]
MTKQITLTSNHIHSQPTSQPESPLRGFPLGTPPAVVGSLKILLGDGYSGLFFLQETYAPYLLEQKAKKIDMNLDVENSPKKIVRTVYESQEVRSYVAILPFLYTASSNTSEIQMAKHIRQSLDPTFQLFAREAIVQILGIYMAFIYGIFYLFLTTMPLIFSHVYHEGPGIGGLHYIALGIGLTLSSQFNARFMDKVYLRLKKKNGEVGEPEFRILTMLPGTFCLPIGLLVSGWAAQNNLHWIGIALVGAGLILVFQSIQTYVVDAFTLHAASALAAVSCLRSLAGFAFPLFATKMYNKLAYGKGNTILAFLYFDHRLSRLEVDVTLCSPFLLWTYGKRIRMSSTYASKPQTHRPSDHDSKANESPSPEIKT